MNLCETCKYRKPKVLYVGTPGETTAWYCIHPKIGEAYGESAFGADSLTYDYCEGGGFQVGPKFGCVHHEKKD